MTKRQIILIVLTLVIATIQAAITFTAKAPSVVSVGEQFRLQYSINTINANGTPQISSIQGFKVLYGPAVSSNQSIQVINGKTTQSASTSFIYTIVAEKEGTFVLPSASIVVDGHTHTSNKVTVKVVKSGGATNSQKQQSSSPHQLPSQATSGRNTRSISPQDLYIEVSANKREVYEQEPVLLSYNVYTNLMLEQLQGKMPDLKGFVAKEIPLPREKQLSVVHHNGRTTQTTTWSQYVMFPQQSGSLTIPSISFESTLLFPNHNVDPVDAFFFGSNATMRVNHTIKAPSVSINVKPLPAKPLGFTGAVGRDFKVTASLATAKPRANETLTLQLKISGLGNVDLITPPEVIFPADFETIDPKSNVSVELTTQGMQGEMVIDYFAIPNHEGKYTVPPVKFVYFDTKDGAYHTLSTSEPIVINVAKGNPNSYAARQRLKKDDIRNIHLGSDYQASSSSFWGNVYYWLIIVALIMAFFGGNKAMSLRQRLSTSRLKEEKFKDSLAKAKQHLGRHEVAEYYAEVLKALQGVVANKTSVVSGDITSERTKELLSGYGIDESIVSDYMGLLGDCEYHIYGASMASDDEMRTNYEAALCMIAKLNKTLKKKKK